MTPDERKAWLDSLRPYDQVLYIRRSRNHIGSTPSEARAEVVDILADCIVLKLLWFEPESSVGGFVRERRVVSRAGEWANDVSMVRIEPMSDEDTIRFGNGDRRAWIEYHIQRIIGNLGSDDLRRFATLLGYEEPGS